MKRLIMTSFVTLSFIFFLNMTANASELINVVSGLDKSYEVTFDTYRVITGEAQNGTKIVIKHYIQGEDNVPKLNKVSIKNVGISEIFADILKLEVGTNSVKIEASLNDITKTLNFVLNKKDDKIKQKLDEVGNIFDISIK